MFKKRIILWVEDYFFRPNLFQKLLSFLFLPLSIIYGFIQFLKRFFAKQIDFGIPIVSVGNLVLGGSGKTPLILALAKDYEKCAIILRGYKRQSKGLHVIKDFKNIKENIKSSGDEAMLYAKSLENTLVIVSEDRIEAIKKAKELGAKIIFLDDGFSKSNIKKFDILIEPNPYPKNTFCLPSGGFREFEKTAKVANLILRENTHFIRKTYITNPTKNMVLVTAIANASRLDKFLPSNVVDKFIFPDHYAFNKKELEEIIKKTNATSILTTRKDWVKMEEFNLSLSFLELEIILNDEEKNIINTFLHE